MRRFSYKITFFLILLSLISCKTSNTTENNHSQLEENWNFVVSTVDSVRIPFNERNILMEDIYANISIENFEANLKRLNKIKELSPNIERQTSKSIAALKSKILIQDTVFIFKNALDYLITIKSIEPLLPQLYDKIYNDIQEIPTKKNESIIKVGQQIENKGVYYILIMEKYHDQFN